MKKFQKIIALLLSMLVILSVSPIAAFAEGEETPEETAEAAWFTSYGVRKGEGTLAEAVQYVNAGGRIDIIKDITAFDAAITFDRNVTINGGGYTITRSDDFASVMFYVDDATVTFKNLTINGNNENFPGFTNAIFSVGSGQLILDEGTVLTENNARLSNGAAIIANGSSFENKATVQMNAGSEISNCTGNDGGAVYLGNNAEMIMNGGTIKNCKASYDGGAVAVSTATSSFTMTDGLITECSSSLRDTGYAGSAIYAGNGAVAVSGGKITGNTNMSDRGALYIASAAHVTVGNTAYIYGNDGSVAESNIYIANNAVLNVSPSFAEGGKCGVSTTSQLREGDTVDMSFINSADDVMGYIYNDYDGTTFYNSNGVVTLIQCIKVTFDPGNGTCPVGSKIYAVDLDFGELPECEEREGFEFLGWYTATDSLVTENTAVSYYEDITLYAKWENLNKLDDSPFAAIGRFFERIGELMRSVFEFLENLFTGKGNDELEKIEK